VGKVCKGVNPVTERNALARKQKASGQQRQCGWRELKHDVRRLVMNMDEEEHVVVSETP